MGVAEDVMAKYPNLSFLLNDPEVGPLLIAAVDPYQGFSPETFQTKLYQTNWWRTRSKSGRENEILKNTDPTTYRDKEYGYGHELRAHARGLGLELTPDQLTWFSTLGLNAGMDANSQQMTDYLLPLFEQQGGRVLHGYGAAGVAKQEISNIIRGAWFQPIDSWEWLADAAIGVASGHDTLESVNARVASQAWGMFPHLKQQLEAGQTLADIFNPYRQVVAEELEMGSLEDVDMSPAGEWRSLMSFRDPTTGETRLPTESEVRTMARKKPQWWQTSHGKEADAGATRSLLQIFGQVA